MFLLTFARITNHNNTYMETLDKPSISKNPKLTEKGNKQNMKVIASWSGGKDSCFALHKAIQQGHSVQNLLIMMQDKGTSNFHMISQELLDAQSEAIGIPIVKISTTPETYEQQFKKALLEAKAKGEDRIITGDNYDVALHEAGWLDKITKEICLKPVGRLCHREDT